MADVICLGEPRRSARLKKTESTNYKNKRSYKNTYKKRKTLPPLPVTVEKEDSDVEFIEDDTDKEEMEDDSLPELSDINRKSNSKQARLHEEVNNLLQKINKLEKYIRKMRKNEKFDEASRFKKITYNKKKEVEMLKERIRQVIKEDEASKREKRQHILLQKQQFRRLSCVLLGKDVRSKRVVEPVSEKVTCICNQVCSNHVALHDHIIKEHNDSFHCGVCGLFRFEVQAQFSCPVCSLVVENKNEHIRIHFQVSSRPNAYMECRLCPKQFRTIAEVMEHENNHKMRDVFTCRSCKSRFSTRENFHKHKKIHEEFRIVAKDLTELQVHRKCKKLECPLCNKHMLTRNDWWMHILLCSRTIDEDTKEFRIAKRSFIGDDFMKVDSEPEVEEGVEDDDVDTEDDIEEKPKIKEEIIDDQP